MTNSTRAISAAEFQILLSLVDGPKHGHRIKLDVDAGTEGKIVMGPGTLYGGIKRLIRRNWIEEVGAPVVDREDDERRRYYRVTPSGLNAAKTEAERLSALVGMARTKRLVQR